MEESNISAYSPASLVSFDNNKFIEGVNDNDKDWINLTNFIISSFRDKIDDGNKSRITPEEMISR